PVITKLSSDRKRPADPRVKARSVRGLKMPDSGRGLFFIKVWLFKSILSQISSEVTRQNEKGPRISRIYGARVAGLNIGKVAAATAYPTNSYVGARETHLSPRTGSAMSSGRALLRLLNDD